MLRDLEGTLMPENHSPRCSHKDCAVGTILNAHGVCISNGMWWHQSCPCWKEMDKDVARILKSTSADLEDYIEVQLIKDSLYTMYKWIDQNASSKEECKDIVYIAYKELNSLLRAMCFTEKVNRKELITEIRENPNVELMFYLLLLKLASLNNIVANFITEE
jgi:hypothetical protein